MYLQRARLSHWRRLLAYLAGLLPEGAGPEYAAGELGDTDADIVEVTFSEAVTATDYAAGVVIKKNSVSQTISSATRQGDQSLVHFDLAADADVNDALTWEYDDDLGDYQDGEGDPLADVSATALRNLVGCHLYFDTADDALWMGAL